MGLLCSSEPRSRAFSLQSPCKLTFGGEGGRIFDRKSDEFSENFNCQWGGSFFSRWNTQADDVVRPSPWALATSSSATLCSSSMHSLRSIHWYPSHPQYVKGSQISRGRPSGARWGPMANQYSLASQKFVPTGSTLELSGSSFYAPIRSI